MSSNKNIIVLGSCSVDFTSYAERLPKPGETLHGYKFTTTFGGKGANQAVAASKLGGKVSMISKVGDDVWGKDYVNYLNKTGVDTNNISFATGETTGIAQINVSESGENQIVIVPGANNKLSIEDVKRCKDVIEDADVLVCQLETPIDATLEAFRLCKGIKILNAAPGFPNLNKELLQLTTVLCVNETEAELITGKSLTDIGVGQMLSELPKTGCNCAILTLGSKGAGYVNERGQVYQVACDFVTPVDTTGAGDAFAGALATLLACKGDTEFKQIIGAACRVATESVTKEGTQTSYPTLDVREYLLKNYDSVALTYIK